MRRFLLFVLIIVAFFPIFGVAQDVQEVNETAETKQVATQQAVKLVRPQEGDEVVIRAMQWKGDVLPKMAYGRTWTPEKRRDKERFFGEGLVLNEDEFGKFLEMYCPEAYVEFEDAISFAKKIAIPGAGPFMLQRYKEHFNLMMEIYNSSCAGFAPSR